ncbi:hypothetical protein GOL85_13515 [Sinorhizobium medicae]|nr:hypothetical protein [Sinorhizobium medicae]
MQNDYPEDVMTLAEEALDNLLCNCTKSCGGYDGLRAASISDIARAIMQDRASRIRSCLLDKPEAVEGEPAEKPSMTENRPEWIWYCESTSGVPVVTFGRWPKHPQQVRYKLAEIQPTEHDHPAAFASEPADTDAAQREITRLRRELEEARKALEPFARFAENVAYQEGEFSDGFVWQSAIHRGSISTWFGPSDFGVAFAALRAGEEGK